MIKSLIADYESLSDGTFSQATVTESLLSAHRYIVRQARDMSPRVTSSWTSGILVQNAPNPVLGYFSADAYSEFGADPPPVYKSASPSSLSLASTRLLSRSSLAKPTRVLSAGWAHRVFSRTPEAGGWFPIHSIKNIFYNQEPQLDISSDHMYLVREAVSPTTSSYNDHLRDQTDILTASSSQLDGDDEYDVVRLREADKQNRSNKPFDM
ncbi:hypothetical protein PGT21_019860 [Puccinia graminis f. sp. tritici]|uniref:Uncharacterized protein n=1 Tax=Puccinia graminis f. sp. tritici TaxID=56615 RepID=A0A5B0NQN3_PUCGR|nr:hypothetical protein PGT21_019860 [Puccinia graminis f. sp. tritici]KAA1125558.1 hypothetical protein PGTUg99_019541 [Puccinia graminis f. sp. tritici]